MFNANNSFQSFCGKLASNRKTILKLNQFLTENAHNPNDTKEKKSFPFHKQSYSEKKLTKQLTVNRQVGKTEHIQFKDSNLLCSRSIWGWNIWDNDTVATCSFGLMTATKHANEISHFASLFVSKLFERLLCSLKYMLKHGIDWL